MISFHRNTHHSAWALFLPRRDARSPDGIVWTSYLTFGAELGWFGFRISLAPRPVRLAREYQDRFLRG